MTNTGRTSLRPFAGAALVLLVSCGSGEEPRAKAPLSPPTAHAETTAESDEQLLAEVPTGTVGPYLVQVDDGWLAIWSGAEDDTSPAFRTIALDASGAVIGPAKRVAESSDEVRLVQVRPIDDGALVTYTIDRGEDSEVAFLPLGTGGELRGAQVELSQASGQVIWIDSAAVDGGALVFWGVEADGHAVLSAARWEAESGLGRARVVHSDAVGWQVAGGANAALLAVVNPAGDVELVSVGAAGEVTSTTSLASAGHATREIDLVATERGFVVVYASRERIEPQLMSAVVGADGRALTRPTPVATPLGDQALIDLVGGAHGYLIWQNPSQEPAALRLAALNAAGRVTGKQRALPLSGKFPIPQFAARAEAPSALTWNCDDQAACDDARPTLIDFDRKLDVLGSRRWEFDGKAPDLAWSLNCRQQSCLGLAARFGDPTRVYAERSLPYDEQPATAKLITQNAVSALQAQLETELLAGLSAVPADGGTLLSWLTFFDPTLPYEKPSKPAPDGRLAPVRALLKTLWVDDEGTAFASDQPASEEVISYRARSLSGISVSSRADRHLLVWSAIDGSSPQVFTTLLDSRGKKIAQRMQSRAKGEIWRVVSAPLPEGWLLGWIDDREGQAKSYLAVLDDRLNKKARELQMPESEDEVTAIDLQVLGEQAWVLTSEADRNGRGQVRLLRLDAARLKPLGATTPLSGLTDELSHVGLVIGPKRRWATWIEGADEAARVMVRELSEQGEPMGTARPLELTAQPVSLSSRCNPDECWLLIHAAKAGAPALFEASLGASDKPRRLLRLRSREAARLPVAANGDDLWLFDTIGRDSQGIHHALLNATPSVN